MFSSLIPSSWRSPSPSPSSSPEPPNSPKETNPLNPQGLKPCCACPETKSNRDECFLRHDPATAEEACKELVRKHVECMRGYGFKI